jgi:N-methylhydantoinase A
MAAEARATLTTEKVPDARIELGYSADIRYVGQFNEVEVPLPGNGTLGASGLEQMADAFHERHDSLYGYSMRGAPLELINLRVTARGRTDKPMQEKFELGDAYFDGEFISTPVFDGLKLEPGNRVEGPAIVVQPTTTIVIPPDFALRCDEYRNYLMYMKSRDVDELCRTLR